jgi:hypothetical protein
VAYIRDDETEQREFDVPGMAVRTMRAMQEGKMSPLQVMKGLMGNGR